MSKWQSENLPEAFFNPFLAAKITAQIAAQTIEYLPDSNALLNKQLHWQTINKPQQLHPIKLDPQDTPVF